MRVLVTGGAGYVGSAAVTALLEAGHQVRVVDSLRWGGRALLSFWSHPGFEFRRGDVTIAEDRQAALEGMEAVVHLAALVGDPACKREPEWAEKVNLEATRALVDEARGCQAFLFASTCSNYGVSDPESLATEESPLNPQSLYARTKVEAERYILERAPGPTVLRLATVYGVSGRMRFDLTVNEFARDAAMGRQLVVYGERHWRPYIHVRDVGRAAAWMLGLPSARREGQVFNLGHTQENYQKLGLCELLKERIPDLDVKYVATGPDPRSYRVSFARVEALGFTLQHRVPQGLDEVIALTRGGAIDVDDQGWTN